MRLFLILTLLCLSLSGVASAAAPTIPVGCLECGYYPHVCVVIVFEGRQYTFCVDLSGGTGIWLEPKPEYQSAQAPYPNLTATSEMSLQFNSQLDKQGMAKVLNESTGWGVDMSGALMISPFPAGAYTGTLTQVAQQIALSGNASVTVDQANRKLIFGLPE